MKMFSKYVLGAMCVGAFALSTGAFIKVNASPAIEAVPSGQPIDLTYAAEKALPAVVHIKYVQNSKVQTVDVQEDPFSDFFGPFGFFGNLSLVLSDSLVILIKGTATRNVVFKHLRRRLQVVV